MYKIKLEYSTKGFLYVAAYFIINLISTVIAMCFISLHEDGPVLSDKLLNNPNLSVITTLIMGVIFIIFFIYNKEKINKIIKPVNESEILYIISISILMYLILSSLFLFIYNLIPGDIVDTYNVNKLISFTTMPVSMFFAYSLIGPIIEEFIFRYGLQRNLMKINYKIGIFVQALVFSVCHLNLIQGIYTFIMGLVLGNLYYKSNENLAYTIACHIVFNSIPVILYLFNQEGNILLITLYFTVCALFYYFSNRISKNQLPII